MDQKPGFDVEAAHGFFAAHCFNQAWDLMEKPQRTPEEDRLMVAMSQASIFHWLNRADCDSRRLSIGYWQASRIHALLRNSAEAQRNAEICLSFSDGLEPFYIGYAHEALARAAALAGRQTEAEQHVERATQQAALVAREGDRHLLLNDLGGLRAVMTPAAVSRTRFEHAHPILNVASLARSLRYYVDVLGFTDAEWGGHDFTCVTRDGASIYLSEGDQGQSGTWVWLGVDDVELLYDEYRQHGATILLPPMKFSWAFEMRISDPDGHVLRFGSDSKEAA